MDKTRFHALVTKYLLPLLGGALQGEEVSSTKQRPVAYIKPNILAVKPYKMSTYRLIIWRSQKFSKEERILAEEMVNEFISFCSVDERYCSELEDGITRRVVVNFLGKSKVLADIIRHLEGWSSQTYEGGRISSVIGLLNNEETNGDGVSLEEFFQLEFSPLISNGFDTIATFDSSGLFIQEEALSTLSDNYTSPFRLSAIADWSVKGVAVVLNRHGEIIVFADGVLKFAKRSGKWYFYAHDPVVSSIKFPRNNRLLREAIYASCLDVSFARSGGCIAVLAHKLETSTLIDMLNMDEIVLFSESAKAKTLKAIINERSVEEIDRRIRQELLSIDGALIINKNGVAIDIGTIVKVPGGSEGGGRLAAAKNLSNLGVGIKISEDGSIIGFEKEVEIFRL